MQEEERSLSHKGSLDGWPIVIPLVDTGLQVIINSKVASRDGSRHS